MDGDCRKLTYTDAQPAGKNAEGGWFGPALLLLLLLLEAGSLVSLTFWHQQRLDRAEQGLEAGDRLLRALEGRCGGSGDLPDAAVHEDDKARRVRRQTISSLFHELLAVQVQVLSSVCDQNPDLCTKGPKGIQGDEGDAGVPGNIGQKGDPGPQGPTGDKGPTGPPGDAGVAGHQGTQGLTGDAGPQGPKGGAGDTGPKGDPGTQGPTGAAGPVGLSGQKGQPGALGVRGPTGAQGATGAKGGPGDAGPLGAAGTPGPAGPPGKEMEGDCLCVDVPTMTGNFTDVVTARLHHPLTLHCDVSDPKATVGWQRVDGKPLGNRVHISGNDIIFSSVSPAEEGVYECVANTMLGKAIKEVDIRLFAASPYDCDFEDDFCSWSNIHDDIFDWTRNRGTTPTAGTGPSTDHTMGTQTGEYAYIETSSPRTNHDAARLQSSILNPQQEYCLSFWYHMYGANLGNINVRLSSNGVTGDPVQTLIGPSQDQWKQVFYTIHPQSTPFRIVIEGVSGPGYQGDAAIDDIGVTESSCT